MVSVLTTVQWNIGGGKILKAGTDPTLMASYSEEGFNDIVSFLRTVNADIITLQEVHSDEFHNQAEAIAAELGLRYIVSDFYADSHVQAGQRLGHAILSRFPIRDHHFELFVNINKSVPWEDGTTATTHDKGFTSCSLDVEGTIMAVMTTHLIPFRPFGIELESSDGRRILTDVQQKLNAATKHLILQGDFNLDVPQLAPIMPSLFTNLSEVTQVDATTPKGRRYDHIAYRGLTLRNTETHNTVLTDHYPVVSRFSID